MNIRKKVVVERIEPHQVTVRFGDGVTDIEILRGLNIPRDHLKMMVGEEGCIVFRAFPSYSLWFWEDNSRL